MKKSAGILVYRLKKDKPEVLLVHPGGPFYKNKDISTWTIPKGEFDDNEDAFEAAKREFLEETGYEIEGNYIQLSPVKQNGGKWVHAWAVECDLDTDNICSNTFTLEWPPKSGKKQDFPEIDKAGWFTIEQAREKILNGQIPILEELMQNVIARSGA
ncbi:MAG TPA: NUDIX domain-containing protein [Bacteroidales bacterium]|nr:NUDIX domain-containing protein [Bacteroidales bacterium]